MTKTQKQHFFSEADLMYLEYLMRAVVSEKKYYGSASSYRNPTYLKAAIKCLINKLIEDVDGLIAEENFKASIVNELEKIIKEVNLIKKNEDYPKLLTNCLRAISFLLGYHYQSGGKKYQEPYFIPTLWREAQNSEDPLKYYNLEQSVYKKRAEIVFLLKKEGKTNAEIVRIMNLTNYRVAQILKGAQND